MAGRRDKSIARARGRMGRVAGWLTESRGVAAAVAFLLGAGLQSADLIGRILPDQRTMPSDLVSRVEIGSSDVVSELGTMMLLPYETPLPAFLRGGECSESGTRAMARKGHQVGLWLRLTMTNSSHGAGASELFVSNLRADRKRQEKPVPGVQLWCRARAAGGNRVAYLAGMNLDLGNHATVVDDSEPRRPGEFAAAVGLQPGESVQFDLYVTARDFDYSFVLVADVLCAGCERTTVQLGGQERFRVHSAAAAAPYVLRPAARKADQKQRFHVSPADEIGGKPTKTPLKLPLSQVPRRDEQKQIMEKLALALGSVG